MGRDGCLVRRRDDLLQPFRAIQCANRRDANGGATSLVALSQPRGVARLMKFPERLDAGVHALPAAQQFATHGCVTNLAVLENRAGHRNRSLGVVGGLADQPLAPRISDIPRDCGPGVPSNPRTPSGYHRTTASRDNVSVCLPIASPVATPLQRAENPGVFDARHATRQGRGSTPSCCTTRRAATGRSRGCRPHAPSPAARTSVRHRRR